MLPVWLNGELLDPADASVPVFDHGLTVGDGVFETMRTARDADGAAVPVAITRHLRRLRRSLAGLGLRLDWSDDALRAALLTVAAAVVGDDPAAVGRVRLTVTGGAGPLGSGRDGGPVTVFVAGALAEPMLPTTTAVLVPWRRNEHSAVAGLKTTSYAENVVALAEAKRQGADEALFANTAGHLCEGTGSNVFVVLDGVIHTPPLSSGCLAGVTRELVCEVIDVVETDLDPAVVHDAEEMFLTSSTRDVKGLHRVGDRTFTAPGPLTLAAADAFAALLGRTLDP